jgi:hypothetical protein
LSRMYFEKAQELPINDAMRDDMCWRIKDVSTYDPQAYRPTPFSPRDSQGSCQSAEQGDYKRLIYFYSLTTQTLTMIRLENDYTTLERMIKLSRQKRLTHGSTILEHATTLNTKTDLWWTRRIKWIQGSIGALLPFTAW